MGGVVTHGLDPCIQGRQVHKNHEAQRLDARLEAGHDGRRWGSGGVRR
jgi:hypothetical protein